MKKVLSGLTTALIAVSIFTAATAVRENASRVESSAAREKCWFCKGKGTQDIDCDLCGGTGKYTYYDKDTKGRVEKCRKCNGKKTMKITCMTCKGKKYV